MHQKLDSVWLHFQNSHYQIMNIFNINQNFKLYSSFKKNIFFFISLILISLPVYATKTVHTIDVSEIKPGMKGYGLTVFSGTKPEKFNVAVVDVVPNFLLKEDIILIKCIHPVTDKAGVVGGMSGSPIYINGRLAGALAYGWTFSKDALAGVTPIKNMYQILDRKLRKTAKIKKTAFLQNPVEYLKNKIASSFFGHFDNKKNSRTNFVPARTPLSISGFSGGAVQILNDTLKPFAMDTVQGGGSGAAGSLIKNNSMSIPSFKEGDAIGVQLISGDLSATGIGTVTAVRGENVLAFGHPMFNMGESLLPVSTAKIHTVVASLARSNKMGSPLQEAGSLVQDRSAGIMARTDLRAPVIPVSLTIEDTLSNNKESYHVNVANRQWLSGRFIHAALYQFIKHAASDVTDVTVRITGKIKITGHPVYSLFDTGVSRAGITPLLNYFRPSAIINTILNNPFEDVNIESVDFKVKLLYGLSYSTLTGAYLTSLTPKAGDKININISLIDYGGKKSILTIPFKVPYHAEGKKLKLIIGGGNDIEPPMASPQNLDDFLNNIQKYYSADSLVLSLEEESRGVSVKGRALDKLPDSAVISFKPVAGSDETETFQSVSTTVVKTDTIISGKQTIQFTVGRKMNP